jgi:hypothetical protein
MMKNINFSIIGFNNSQDVLKKIKRDRDILKKVLIIQKESKLNDSIINLCTSGYQIKDWLKEEFYIGVEEYININTELKVCADLCNGAKHKILRSFRSKEDPIKDIYSSEITIDNTSYTGDSMMKIDSDTFYIELESGKKYEILFFANRIVELWTKFIKTNEI